MAGFARSILAAHEQAVAYFTGSGLSGRLRFGVTDDLALTPVPSILRDFRQLYPRIDLELTVSQSGTLQRRVESGHLDVAFVKQAAGEGRGRLVRRDRLIWAAAPGTKLEAGRRVSLVVYQAPSISRSLGVQALERAGLPYRVTCTVRGVLGVVAAARAGLGGGDLRAQPRPRRSGRAACHGGPAGCRGHRPHAADQPALSHGTRRGPHRGDSGERPPGQEPSGLNGMPRGGRQRHNGDSAIAVPASRKPRRRRRRIATQDFGVWTAAVRRRTAAVQVGTAATSSPSCSSCSSCSSWPRVSPRFPTRTGQRYVDRKRQRIIDR